MLFTKLACAAALTSVVYAQNNNNGGNNGGNNNNGATGTTLLANAIQSGSTSDGSVNGQLKDGQSASKTSTNNFINNCSGKTLTNGLQVQAGSCNGIPMGDIPAKANMISGVILFPSTASGPVVQADTTFNIDVQISNLVAGTFTNADTTYYAAPQFLQGGKVVGHTHVTVQDMGNSLNPQQPLDPTQFAFFKGINDAGNGQGKLSAVVTGGLPAGNYRVCTMTAASNHQPVLMPVAQRGTPDDCTKFIVGNVAGGGNNGGNNGGNANAGNANAGNANAGNKGANANGGKNANAATGGNANGGNGNAASSTSAAAGSATSVAAANGGNANGGKNGGNANGANGNKNAVSTSSAAASASTGNANGGNGGNRFGGGNKFGGGNRGGRKQRRHREFIV